MSFARVLCLWRFRRTIIVETRLLCLDNSSRQRHHSPCDVKKEESLCNSYEQHRLLALDVNQEYGLCDLYLEDSLSDDFQRDRPLDVKVIQSLCDSHQKHRRLACDVKEKADHFDFRGLAGIDQAKRHVLATECGTLNLATSLMAVVGTLKPEDQLALTKPSVASWLKARAWPALFVSVVGTLNL
ncbi:hypothetical protein C8J56DRAFT_1063409 [Mycena floridula]|nr:hypothetical protein C8J56DRAFT_1063409 [Mycena floridula]